MSRLILKAESFIGGSIDSYVVMLHSKCQSILDNTDY